MATTTTTQVSPVLSTFYDRLLLVRAKPYLIHNMFSQKRSLPKKNGNTINFRRYGSLSSATTPISEGITPGGSQLSTTDLTATVSQYGDYIEITDVVDLTTEDAVISESIEILADQFSKTIDQITRDILSAAATGQNCAGGSNGNTPTEITKSDIDTAIATLRGNDAVLITQIVNPTTGVGTVPIPPSYIGFADTDMEKDISSVSNFVSIEGYGSQMNAMQPEYGSTGRIRWLTSSVGKATSESPVQYHNFIIGANSYGSTELEGGGAKTIIKAFGSGGTSDPLDQRSTVAWKCFYVCRILNDNHLLNLEATLSS